MAALRLPPPLTPVVTEERKCSGDILLLLKFMQESEANQDELRRREDRLLQMMSHMMSGTVAQPKQAVPVHSATLLEVSTGATS